MKLSLYRAKQFLGNLGIYLVLVFFAFIMLFPFLYMLSTSFKIPSDTFRYPPRMLPRDPQTIAVAGYDDPLPLYYVELDGQKQEFALAKSSIKVGIYADPNDLATTYERRLTEVSPTGGAMDQKTVELNGLS